MIKDIAIIGLLVIGALLKTLYGANWNFQIAVESITWETSTIFLLCMVGLFDILSHINLSAFVPNFYARSHQSRVYDEVKFAIENVIKEESNLFKGTSDTKIDYILGQMGISKNQFSDLRYDIIKMRAYPIKTREDAKERLKALLRTPEAIVEVGSYSKIELAYGEVKDLFINLTDIMFIRKYAKDLVCITVMFILNEYSIEDIDKFVMPESSNFLLGFYVSQELNKPLVIMRESGKIIKSEPWDGILKSGDRVLIMNDVIVTGDKIQKANEVLVHRGCKVMGCACLVQRTEYKEVAETLKKDGIETKSLLIVGDKQLNELRKVV